MTSCILFYQNGIIHSYWVFCFCIQTKIESGVNEKHILTDNVKLWERI